MSRVLSEVGQTAVKWLLPGMRPLFRMTLRDKIFNLPLVLVRTLVESGVYGIAAGLSGIAFEISVYRFYSGTLVRFAHWSSFHFVIASFLLVTGTSLASGIIVAKFAPETAGSGIPQLKLAFWKDSGFIHWRVIWVKFVAGVLTVGGGASLGREGPSIQLSGAVASNLSVVFGTPTCDRRRAMAAGAAAGLAATFNAPLAAIAFVLEKILIDCRSNLLGGVVMAALVGALVFHVCVGQQTSFVLPVTAPSTWNGQFMVPFAALLATLAGVLFQSAALGLRKLFQRSPLHQVPLWARPALGAFFTWTIGASVFLIYGRLGIFSLGYDDINSGLQGDVIGVLPLVLLLGKLPASICSFGSGGCGGVFAPGLFLGGMTGCALVELSRAMGLPLTEGDRILLMLAGMSSCLGAIMRAPLTSILLVLEMTREYSLFFALLIPTLLSQGLSRWLLPHGVYEQILVDDGHFPYETVERKETRP